MTPLATGPQASRRNAPRRLLLVEEGAAGNGTLQEIRRHLSTWSVSAAPTYLQAIAELTRRPAAVVVTGIDALSPHVGQAIAGLREAAGPSTKLLLLSRPEDEPLARQVLAHGADDYLISPLRSDELEQAVAPQAPADWPAPDALAEPTLSLVTLADVSALMSLIDSEPGHLLTQLARAVHRTIAAAGVAVIVDGSMASAGEPITTPALHAPIVIGDDIVGQLALGEPNARPYTEADARKLTALAQLAGSLLHASRQQQHFRRLAMTDELSGLSNRRHFMHQLELVLDQAAGLQLPVTVMMFDIDDFKRFNDDYGHDLGDEIIRRTGQLLTEHFREQDLVGRLGGDEFGVIFWDEEGPREAGSRPPQEALTVLKRFSQALREQTFPGWKAREMNPLTISAGLATYPWCGHEPAELMKRADEALLAAKRAGKDRIFITGQRVGEVVDESGR